MILVDNFYDSNNFDTFAEKWFKYWFFLPLCVPPADTAPVLE